MCSLHTYFTLLMAFLQLYTEVKNGDGKIYTIPEEYLKSLRLVKVAIIALEKHQPVLKIVHYHPFYMWCTGVLDFVREEVRLQGRF